MPWAAAPTPRSCARVMWCLRPALRRLLLLLTCGDAEYLRLASVKRAVAESACPTVGGRGRRSCTPLGGVVADDDVDDVEQAVDVVVGLGLGVVVGAVSECELAG